MILTAHDRDEVVYIHGDVCIRKERKKRRKLILWELLYEFSRSTTLHGLRYITEQGLSITEKVFWFITFMTSVCMCSYLIYNVYDKWQSTPVIVTISEDLVPVTNIPFPSVTICPQTKCRSSEFNYSFYQQKVDRIFDQWLLYDKNETEPWLMKFIDLSTICENDVNRNYLLDLVSQETPRNASLVHNLEQVAEPLSGIFARCNWRTDKWAFCNDYFNKVLTQEGVCYNFNSLAASEILKLENVQRNYSYLEAGDESLRNGWHPDHGYLNASRNLYPRRGRIYIHHPGDLPKSSLYYYAALDDQLSTIAVKCNIVNTSSKLLKKLPKERKCYFEGEKNLTYFNMYTAKNCMLECLSNYTFQKCGCVGFYMPHNDSNQLCHFAHIDCMSEAEDELADIEASSSNSQGENVQRCDCLPSCYTVDYDAEVLKTGFDITTVIKTANNGTYENDIKYSRIVVFFQQPEFVSMRRSELFGKIDFVANCGGLLGLFLGFSVLSIVEVIYFVTLRLWCSLRRDLKQEKKKIKKATKTS
ncbi:hypothetical protein K1T71_005377 [Dendrolimus kikuchii]|uniref:Uncharacterized protein n=1 Tax=Dendrolimus kikuchii TaxID=765133 RepID=A0ACC1D4Z9_9NEOP|nr:hypothetical protein K1T71_005377 [Dendrolimus kikuchii]